MMFRVMVCLVSSLFVLVPAGLAVAQDEAAAFKPEQLDALMAPIALYPDSLLAQVLMACTYPADVAAAADWAAAHKDQEGDAAVKAVEGESWDPSVKSLIAVPSVLAMMKADPDWVQEAGDAFLAQSKDVMDSVQRLRKQAKDAGNLKSSDEMKVTEESSTDTTATPAVQPEKTSTTTVEAPTTTIVIEQTDPEVVYVPGYDTTVVYGSWGYPSYPPYYFPPPVGYYTGAAVWAGFSFCAGVAIGGALWGDCNWGGGDIDIDVDRYNNINVGNEIGSGNNKFNHNAANRGGVPYRDSATRDKFAGNTDRAGASQRSDYRGRDSASAGTRDAQREAARGNLERSTGVSTRDAAGSADRINRDLNSQGINANDLGRGGGDRAGGGGAGTRDLSGAGFDPRVTGGGGADGFDPRVSGGGGASTRDVGGASSNRGGSAGASTRDAGSSRGGGGATTSNMSRSSGSSRSSSAFSGAGSGSSRQSMSRGSSSAGGRSMSGGGRSGGGGGRGGGGRR